MLTFNRFLAEIYNEPDDSSFEHEGHVYDLNGLLSATLGMRPTQFPVESLTWIFEWDDPFVDMARVESEDLNAAILVTEGADGRLVVLDGLHRLGKAVLLHQASIKGVDVSREMLQRYRIR